MLDFLKPFVSLNCPITDWIMVIVAILAAGTWKREIKGKKKYDLAFKLYEIVLKIEKIDYAQETVLNSIYLPLKTIAFEYDCLNEKQNSLDYFINKFSFCEKDSEEFYKSWAAFLLSISTIDSTVKNEFIGQESQTFYSKLMEVKEFCRKELKDFYKL